MTCICLVSAMHIDKHTHQHTRHKTGKKNTNHNTPPQHIILWMWGQNNLLDKHSKIAGKFKNTHEKNSKIAGKLQKSGKKWKCFEKGKKNKVK